MFTLENFYRSNEWQNLIKVLKLERLNDKDELICWHCGKPITKEYDAIGHHTIFLNSDNVNHYDISLNPDLIRFVHHRCHNKIHNKLGFVKREIFLVYGSPLSGKTTWAKDNMDEGDLLIDIDNIWECVSGCERYVKPKRLNAVVFGVRDELMRMVKYKVGKWNNAYIVGGFPLISERERLCKTLGAREIYIECSKEECISRLELSDNIDKSEWKKYIDDWWKKYTPHV